MQSTDHERPRGANGHADPLAEADTLKLDGTLPWPSQRRTLGERWRSMTGRPARAAAGEVAGGRPMPSWMPTVIVTLGLAFISNFGWFMYWKGGADRDLAKVSQIDTMQQQIAELKTEVKSLTAQRTELSQYVGELAMWASEVRNKLMTTGRMRPQEVPTLPDRNGRGF